MSFESGVPMGLRFDSEDRHEPAAHIIGACEFPWIDLPWLISLGTCKDGKLPGSGREPGSRQQTLFRRKARHRLAEPQRPGHLLEIYLLWPLT